MIRNGLILKQSTKKIRFPWLTCCSVLVQLLIARQFIFLFSCYKLYTGSFLACLKVKWLNAKYLLPPNIYYIWCQLRKHPFTKCVASVTHLDKHISAFSQHNCGFGLTFWITKGSNVILLTLMMYFRGRVLSLFALSKKYKNFSKCWEKNSSLKFIKI